MDLMNVNELYVKIYIKTELDAKSLKRKLEELLNGLGEDVEVTVEDVDIDLDEVEKMLEELDDLDLEEILG